tara:strand:- start:249 stop:824 length:576 start_codon:yes stop_codon:yes gene_type:complete
MKVIAVLGDIGSGKSFVAKKFNCPVFNADEEVSIIYNKNYLCFRKLNKEFPQIVKKFPIDKNELIRVLIKNTKNLKRIIKIVHPLVRIEMHKFLNKNRKKKLVVLDIPLLLENKLNKKNFILLFINANAKKVKFRLKKRKNFNEKIYKELKKLQISLKIKKKLANFEIYNDFKMKNTFENVKSIKNKILQR